MRASCPFCRGPGEVPLHICSASMLSRRLPARRRAHMWHHVGQACLTHRPSASMAVWPPAAAVRAPRSTCQHARACTRTDTAACTSCRPAARRPPGRALVFGRHDLPSRARSQPLAVAPLHHCGRLLHCRRRRRVCCHAAWSCCRLQPGARPGRRRLCRLRRLLRQGGRPLHHAAHQAVRPVDAGMHRTATCCTVLLRCCCAARVICREPIPSCSHSMPSDANGLCHSPPAACVCASKYSYIQT